MNIYPSLMVVPKADIKKEIDLLQSHCAGFHLDVIDNIFVPNLLWNNPDQINNLVKMIKNQVWIHLMIENPADFYEQLVLPYGSLVSFHIESKIDIVWFSKIIKEKKHGVSLAICPKTTIDEVIPFLNIVDQVLVMSVEPGFPGQRFLDSSFEKIGMLVKYRQENQLGFKVGVDGGINKSNIGDLVQKGVDAVAVATAIFGEDDHLRTLQELL